MSNDGGPAFPEISYIRLGDRERGDSEGGMTLRDYLAGQALAGIMTRRVGGAGDRLDIAFRAYEIADTMLEERAK